MLSVKNAGRLWFLLSFLLPCMWSVIVATFFVVLCDSFNVPYYYYGLFYALLFIVPVSYLTPKFMFLEWNYHSAAITDKMNRILFKKQHALHEAVKIEDARRDKAMKEAEIQQIDEEFQESWSKFKASGKPLKFNIML